MNDRQRRYSGGELPSVTAILGELLQDLVGNFAGWLTFGVGTLVLAFLSLVLILPPFLMLEIPLLQPHPDDRYVLPSLALLVVAVAVVAALQLPWTNGQYRALLRYQRGEGDLSVGAPFSEATTDLGTAVAFLLISVGVTMVAMMACYLPALFVTALLGLAWPAIVVHRLGALDAVALSVRHARQYPSWTLGFWALGFGVSLIGSQIPVIGPMLAGPIYMAYHLRVYRQIYGDGEVPVEASVEATVPA